jgi:superoxide dismutase, Cu-Zn family
MRSLSTAAAIALLAAGTAFAQDAPQASATMMDANGAAVGAAGLTAGPHGVLIRAELTGLSPGPHAIHVHETGLCEPPFDSAGGHFAGGAAQHGFLMADGPHAGDLPNIFVPESGAVTVELESPATLDELLDADGSALVIHAGPDDYRSQPSGASGDRIACGIVARP